MQQQKTPDYAGTIGALVRSAKTHTAAARVAAAEQIAIAYYFDMMAAMTAIRIAGKGAAKMPAQDPMKNAVIAINQECANQKQPYLFTGRPGNVKDMFKFAAGIALPAAS